jgi:hypothetical protein
MSPAALPSMIGPARDRPGPARSAPRRYGLTRE